MYTYEFVLQRLVARVQREARHQVSDPARPDHGAWIIPTYGVASADHTATGAALARACYALLADGSTLRGDGGVFAAIEAAIAFTARWQRPTGLIDLPKVDFDSPPDTAFLVQLLLPPLELASRRAAGGDAQARRIETALDPLLHSMARAIIGRGFRTPNHRWVVCSALALAMRRWPDLDARGYIDSILAETIDINADGDWSERSSGIYNAICNRAMRILADCLQMPHLLDHVRRNLDLMLHLIDPDGSILTSGSHRQDQGLAARPSGMADSCFDLACRDGNGVWRAMADHLAAGAESEQDAWLIHPFIATPGRAAKAPPASPLPTRYARLLPHSRLWRCRDSAFSATAFCGRTQALELRYERLALTMSVWGTYFHSSRFDANRIEPLENGVRLVHDGTARQAPGWDQPLNRPVEFNVPAEYYDLVRRGERQRWKLPPLSIYLDVLRVADGLDVRLYTQGGMDRILFTIELMLKTPGQWESADIAQPLRGGETLLLKGGYGTYHDGESAVAVGPGGDAHRCGPAYEGQPIPDGAARLLIALQTPVDHRLQIRCRPWSHARVRTQETSSS
jgi:hypothetical protein